jgi:hypothetical protein
MLKELKSLKVFDSITFFDKDHSYKIDGNSAAKYSVTGLVNTVKTPFDEEKWAGIKAREYGCTPDEVKQVWKKNNQMSTYQGSVLHSYIDSFYQNKVVPYDREQAKSILGDTLHTMMQDNLKTLVRQFANFYKETKSTILPIKNELVIGDINETKVCGTLDMLSFNLQTNEFEIYDFKTNKEFNEISPYNKKLRPPVEELDDCEYNIYSLQLSLYKHFIEKYTEIKITNLKIVWFTVNNENYKIINLKYLPTEVENLLKKFV